MLIFYFTGTILSKKVQSEGLKKLKKGGRGDLPWKGDFQRKSRLNHAMHLQENYEMDERYFSIFYTLFYTSFFNFI